MAIQGGTQNLWQCIVWHINSSFILQLIACVTTDPARAKQLQEQQQVYECASHFPLEMLVPVQPAGAPFKGYKLK